MKLLARFAAVSAASAALILGTTYPSVAGVSLVVYSGYGNTHCGHTIPDAKAEFVDDGEIVHLTDEAADGHAVTAEVIADGDVIQTFTNTGGHGTAVDVNYSFAEGTEVELSVWVSVDGTACGNSWDYGEA